LLSIRRGTNDSIKTCLWRTVRGFVVRPQIFWGEKRGERPRLYGQEGGGELGSRPGASIPHWERKRRGQGAFGRSLGTISSCRRKKLVSSLADRAGFVACREKKRGGENTGSEGVEADFPKKEGNELEAKYYSILFMNKREKAGRVSEQSERNRSSEKTLLKGLARLMPGKQATRSIREKKEKGRKKKYGR